MSACREQVNVGAYLLGALEPGERDRMQRHLGTCAACGADLHDLAGLPARLAAADLGLVAPQAVPTEQAYRRLTAAAAREASRRGHRRLLAVAAGVVLAALAVVGTGLAVRSADRPQQPDVVTATAGAVHARAVLTPTQNGTSVVLTLGGVPAKETCRLVVVGRDGSRQTASTWTATYHGDASVTGSLSIRPGDIDRITIETLDGRTLLVLPPPAA